MINSFGSIEKPCFLAIYGIVTMVNASFLALTGYSMDEIQNKELKLVLKTILKSNAFIAENTDVKHGVNCFIFTKTLEVKEAVLTVQSNSDEQYYIFSQVNSFDINERFPFLNQLYADNKIGIGVYSSSDFILLRANKVYMDFLPEPFNCKENVIGVMIKDFIPNWENSRGEKRWKEMVDTGSTIYVSEFKDIIGIGKNNYCDNTVVPIKVDGTVRYIVSMLTDVTEKVMSIQEIKEQAAMFEHQSKQLQAIIDNIPQIVGVFDAEGNFIRINTQDTNNYPEQNLKHIGDTYRKGIYFDEYGRELEQDELPFAQVYKGNKVSNMTFSLKYNDIVRYYCTNGAPVFDENGKFIMGIVCSWDTTEQVKIEKTIQKQRDFFSQIINTIDMPFIRISYPDLTVLQINQRALFDISQILGGEFFISEENICGLYVFEALPFLRENFDENLSYLYELERTKTIVHRDMFQIKKNGSPSYYNLIYHPVIDADDKIIEIFLYGTDITNEVMEKKQMEELIRLKDDFLSIISHEFKTPLTVITSTIQLLENIYQKELSQRVKEHLNKIKQNTYRQIRLVNNLLDITRVNAGYMKVNLTHVNIVYFTKALVESVSTYAMAKDISINFSTALSNYTMGIDEDKYERILLNLLSNAIKYSENKKTISVILTAINRDDREWICVEVKDEGIGIPKEKVSIIFERFGQVDNPLTRQAEGSGLGLYLAKLFVETMGGEITVESEVNIGSTFTVLIPNQPIAKGTEAPWTESCLGSRLIHGMNIEFSDIY